MGIVCPVGNTVNEAWSSILAGKSGISGITRFDASPFASRIAGELKKLKVAELKAPLEKNQRIIARKE